MYNQTEKVNIRPKSYLPVFRVSQNDIGRTLTAHLVSDEGDISIPAGSTVTMAGTKPSGLGYTVTGTVDGSAVSFETDAVMTDEPGRIVSEIRIVQDGTVIGTTNVVVMVEPNPHPDDTTDGQREPLVNELTAILEDITEQADRAEAVTKAVIDMTVTAHESDEATVTKTEGEVVNLDFGLPRGPQGPKGDPGEDGVTPDFTIGTVETLAPGEQATATITGTDEDPVLNLGIPQGAKGDKGDPGEVTQTEFDKLLITDTASGEIATFPDGAALPMRSLKVSLSPIQSGSGTPSPDNVRPISGWDEVETHKTGKNLLDSKPYSGVGYNLASGTDVNLTESSIAITQNDDGFSYEITVGWRMVNFKTAPLKAGTYRVQIGGTVNESRTSVYVVGTDGKLKGSAYNATGTTAISTTKTLLEGEYILVASGRTTVGTQTLISPQVELGTTATAYEPYDGQTITTTLPTTVYGGTLDVVNGTLTVDRAMVDLGTMNWAKYNTQFYANIPSAKIPSYGVAANAICSNYPVVAVSALADKTIAINDGQSRVNAMDSSYADATAFKTAMNGVQLVYELATPTSYSLTPQEVQTLLGRNNVWSDGTVEVVYVADPKLYIEKMIGE